MQEDGRHHPEHLPIENHGPIQAAHGDESVKGRCQRFFQRRDAQSKLDGKNRAQDSEQSKGEVRTVSRGHVTPWLDLNLLVWLTFRNCKRGKSPGNEPPAVVPTKA